MIRLYESLMTLYDPFESMHKGGVAEQSDYHLSAKGASPFTWFDYGHLFTLSILWASAATAKNL